MAQFLWWWINNIYAYGEYVFDMNCLNDIIFIVSTEGHIFVTSLKVVGGDKIFYWGKAKIKYSAILSTLKAGGKSMTLIDLQ